MVPVRSAAVTTALSTPGTFFALFAIFFALFAIPATPDFSPSLTPGPKMADGDPEGEQRMRRKEKASREASRRQEQAEGLGTLSSLT
ncbi:hypothetical protein P4O66_013965 [Electrophorus voltai]|uniref:Uncharacterized protein n=1 Tax=Electrophorus voltai TaxID=2609070 RepID=A0AAD8Z276_9TELE|nr:hypothetical protein P4O66_013965 [Electrophorus voltai]